MTRRFLQAAPGLVSTPCETSFVSGPPSASATDQAVFGRSDGSSRAESAPAASRPAPVQTVQDADEGRRLRTLALLDVARRCQHGRDHLLAPPFPEAVEMTPRCAPQGCRICCFRPTYAPDRASETIQLGRVLATSAAP
ncbi:hypothetical protein MN608_00962 [Microdochium nivale]|nr:hypothetical protein MN608_00962 [Microdochium nivale]